MQNVVSHTENKVKSEVKLEAGWKNVLHEEFSKPYMQKLRAFLKTEIAKGKKIFPRPKNYFAAFEHTPFNKVKVVILGQDPYHGAGQAHGMCFSVRPGVPAPPSLVNMYKELATDVQAKAPKHGCLVSWAEQGVFLLNSVMTVEEGKAGSHRDQGWEKFTDKVVEVLNAKEEPLVFILWGSYAQAKGKMIDRSKHLVIESPHPSPLSSYRGFFGSKPFSKANQFLISKGKTPINWQLPEEAVFNDPL